MNSEQSPQSGALILGNCVNCQGLVRVPTTAAASTEVRCPHCGQTFRLAQILEDVVPELEVVTRDDDEQEESPERFPTSDQFVVPTQLSEGAKRRRKRSRSSRSTDSSNQADPNSLSSGETSDDVPRPTVVTRREPVSSSRRRSPSQRTTGGEIFKVVLGAACAIPIAYLLVFWVFRQDPLNIGPSVGSQVPFLVPAEFRPAGDNESGSPSASGSAETDDEVADDDDGLIPDAAGGSIPLPDSLGDLDQL